MSEDDSAFSYEYTWSPTRAEDLRRHAYDPVGPLGWLSRNYWYVLAASFFGCWGLATALAAQDVFADENLGLVLKAIAAGFIAALCPWIAWTLLERTAYHAALDDDLPVQVSLDRSGCRSSSGEMTTYVPWQSVRKVIETEQGLLLVMRPFILLPLYDARLCRSPDRDDLLQRISEWRKAAQ